MRRTLFLLVAFAVLGAACTGGSGDDTTTTATDATTTTATDSDAVAGSTSTTTTTRAPTTTSTTSTSTSTTTTTRATTTTSTTTIPSDNQPPVVEIVAPAALSAHEATYDASRADFGAVVAFSAEVSDPNGDAVEVEWYATGTGFLGRGESISAWVSTLGSDASQPVIEARAIDQWGTRSSDTIQIIVWIPSDT